MSAAYVVHEARKSAKTHMCFCERVTWNRRHAVPREDHSGGKVVQVLCRCDLDVTAAAAEAAVATEITAPAAAAVIAAQQQYSNSGGTASSSKQQQATTAADQINTFYSSST